MADGKKYIKRLRSKYRLSIYNDQTYAEVWYMRLSRLNVMSFFGIVGILLVAGVVVLIAFTPLREFIPGYPDIKTRRQIIVNALRLDSLQQQVQHWVIYNDNLSRILSGKEPINIEGESDTSRANRYRTIMLTKSKADSIFRKQVEDAEQFNLSVGTNDAPKNIENLHLFPPLRGKVVQHFNPETNYFGVGLQSASPAGAVMAAYEGTVIAVYWTVDMENIVQIQHDFNMVTVYKKLGQCVKKVGSRVSAGEVLGNTSSKSGGTNATLFTFEIWNHGTPVNPERYIVF